MSITSKSPRKVLLVAFKIGGQVLPAYSHRFSPKKFTLPQLFACLVLKSFFKTDYRGVVAILNDCDSLSEAIDLKTVPHFTTLQKAANRLLRFPNIDRLLTTTVERIMGRRKCVAFAAIDSTGLESRHCSSYFVRRRSREPNLWQTTTYTRFPKLGIVCDTSNHVILFATYSRGPSPDVAQFREPLERASRNAKIRTILADAGYDSESNHTFARESLSIRTVIPAKHGRPTSKPAKGKYRRLMQQRFDDETYGQRWQVETVVSMIKRRLGTAASGRGYWSQGRDLFLMVLTHNIMILRRLIQGFLQSSPDPFFSGLQLVA